MKALLKFELVVVLAIVALGAQRSAAAETCEPVVFTPTDRFDYCQSSCPDQPCSCSETDDGYSICCCGE